MAVGDALGSQFDFGLAGSDDSVPGSGVGRVGHGVGEWTAPTSMAIPILEAWFAIQPSGLGPRVLRLSKWA